MAIPDEDLEFFREQAGLVQDGIDPSPDGMINYEEWCAIWTKSALLALRDKVALFQIFLLRFGLTRAVADLEHDPWRPNVDR